MIETLLGGAVLAPLAASIVAIVALKTRQSGADAARVLREEFERSRTETQGSARDLRTELADSVSRLSQQLNVQMTAIASVQNNQIDAFSRQLAELTAANE